jgi:hypothetical protein
VRKLAQSDYIASGQMPLFLKFARGKTPKQEELTDEQTVKFVESMAEITKVKLTRCCGAITATDGKSYRIVDKPNIDDVGELEISIEMLDQADANAICAAIDELSGMTKEAAKAASTFPEGSTDGGGVSSAGEHLQSSADGPASA